jgi:hypothetical protein
VVDVPEARRKIMSTKFVHRDAFLWTHRRTSASALGGAGPPFARTNPLLRVDRTLLVAGLAWCAGSCPRLPFGASWRSRRQHALTDTPSRARRKARGRIEKVTINMVGMLGSGCSGTVALPTSKRWPPPLLPRAKSLSKTRQTFLNISRSSGAGMTLSRLRHPPRAEPYESQIGQRHADQNSPRNC